MKLLLTFFLVTTILLITASIRLLFILRTHRRRPRSRNPSRDPAHILIVLGSGGHTTEMLLILRNLDPSRYRLRTWIVSSGDSFSAEKAIEFERELSSRVNADDVGVFKIVEVPRARRVHQSLATTPWSALRCLWVCLGVLAGWVNIAGDSGMADWGKLGVWYPDIILTNGPGTGVIVVLASVLLRFLDFSAMGTNKPGKMTTVYVESWARVKELSLSGKLLLRVVDRFVVQWPQLKGLGGRAEYRGWLVMDGGPEM
jgi:beta-1,4-N-acetylglucosaminyltransferase